MPPFKPSLLRLCTILAQLATAQLYSPYRFVDGVECINFLECYTSVTLQYVFFFGTLYLAYICYDSYMLYMSNLFHLIANFFVITLFIILVAVWRFRVFIFNQSCPTSNGITLYHIEYERLIIVCFHLSCPDLWAIAALQFMFYKSFTSFNYLLKYQLYLKEIWLTKRKILPLCQSSYHLQVHWLVCFLV